MEQQLMWGTLKMVIFCWLTTEKRRKRCVSMKNQSNRVINQVLFAVDVSLSI